MRVWEQSFDLGAGRDPQAVAEVEEPDIVLHAGIRRPPEADHEVLPAAVVAVPPFCNRMVCSSRRHHVCSRQDALRQDSSGLADRTLNLLRPLQHA